MGEVINKMNFDEEKIKKMYWKDTVLVLIFIAFAWLVVGFVLREVSSLAHTEFIRYVALAAGSAALIFVTSALIAVLVHLKKNRTAIYSEEFNQNL